MTDPKTTVTTEPSQKEVRSAIDETAESYELFEISQKHIKPQFGNAAEHDMSGKMGDIYARMEQGYGDALMHPRNRGGMTIECS